MSNVQVKDVLQMATNQVRVKGLRGRQFRRAVETKFNKLMKKKISGGIGRLGTWNIKWDGDKPVGVNLNPRPGMMEAQQQIPQEG